MSLPVGLTIFLFIAAFSEADSALVTSNYKLAANQSCQIPRESLLLESRLTCAAKYNHRNAAITTLYVALANGSFVCTNNTQQLEPLTTKGCVQTFSRVIDTSNEDLSLVTSNQTSITEKSGPGKNG